MQDCVRAYYDGDFGLNFYYSRPTKKEIESFELNTKCEIRFVEVEDNIFFLIKLGDLPWQDAPFTPHWYRDEPLLIESLLRKPEENGYKIKLTLIDNKLQTKVKNQMINIGYDFSVKLHDCITENYLKTNKSFDIEQYMSLLNFIYNKYSTKDLVQISSYTRRYITTVVDDDTTLERNPKIFDVLNALPDELREWAALVPDAKGLQLLCVPKCFKDEIKQGNVSENDCLVPVPVNFILDKGYYISETGFIYIDAKYELPFGLILPEGYE